MKYTTEEKIEVLRKRLRETENELVRIRQLRPLVDIGDGWSECISFEQMSEFATLWMEQNGIHKKRGLGGCAEIIVDTGFGGAYHQHITNKEEHKCLN